MAAAVNRIALGGRNPLGFWEGERSPTYRCGFCGRGREREIGRRRGVAGDGGLIRVDSCGAATADGEGKKGAGRGAFPFALSGKKRLRLGWLD